MQRVLITGAAGRLGRVLRAGLARPDRILRLTDIADLGLASVNEELHQVDATDLEAVLPLMDGVDVVVHLAAYPEEAAWERIFPLNYALNYAVLEAAHRAGVKRFVFASSVQAVGFHPLADMIDQSARPRPSGYYGVSKVSGEALASVYADKHGMSVGCVRVASFEPRPTDARMLSTWLSHQDGVHLFERCIQAPDHHYYVVYGVSANTRARVDNSHVAWLGYEPRSNAEDYAHEVLLHGDALGPLARVTQGGGACDVGFSGDAGKTLRAD
ncbi:NAD-dependent epimerase/dehydratase family protein [Consotaella salsifontis]|uniref:Uronate dehydrogenase n=1 Tax=Consotaella salsifontis TaxID=1365950 RepID=A0A1T4SPC3_9HYPH|nr:NAD(P)-dependent oxidoreductase [Consotaella salsifontis]SKA30017.1 uronate dehydrogenase [Consotaella salsifontis]